MRLLLTSWLLWIVVASREVKGQSADCPRTNRQPSFLCGTRCDPSTGCSGAEVECLCDGDCGYSCVKKDLSCGTPPRVSNAIAQYPSTRFGETVIYVCNQGYTLSGASERTCRANGRWDGVGPNCLKMCTLPSIPFSTYIKEPVNSNRTYKTGERIKLECKKGFKKQPGGNPIRICISGQWTQFPFKCEVRDCPQPTIPRNANISNPSNKYNSGYKVTFKCNEGYNQEGMATKMCFLGKWTVLSFKCTGTHACKRTIRAARTKCTQECSPESGCGSVKYQCLCDGRCGYSCVEKGMSCGTPTAVSNGNLHYTGTGYNFTAHYTCNAGYSLNTAPVKRCTAKKRWDGITPRCLRDCPQPTIPRNANISNPNNKYNSGYKVTFKCNEGYNQEGMATQMCFLGKWTVLPFKCTEGGCGDPGTPENGRKLGVTYSVNSIVYFNCDLGYELVGSADRKCQLNGTWTGTQPICQVVNCGFPPRPKNGSFIGELTTFQSSLRFKCDDGFELEGSETRMCTSDKNWSGKEVTCSAVDCRKLDPPMNGSLTGEETTYPNHVDIKCDEGFIMRGSHKRTCQANGKWSGNNTLCEAVDCGALISPTNGSSVGTATTFPNTIKFSCDAGFDLIGSFSRTCMADKTWSGEKPVCKAVDCGKLLPPMNGSLLGEESTYPNEVEINCDKGFILRGSHRRKCEADRTWSGDTTVCEAINCGKPGLPDHGSVSGLSTRYPHPITFTCDIGYEIQGPVVRRCQANGTWSGNKTSCKPVDCGPLQVPDNGTKFGDETTFLNKITFHCDDGFDVMGSSSRTCQANKQWSGDETFCKAKDCGPIAVPRNGSTIGRKTTYPNEIAFECDDGFNMAGSRIRKCLSNGIWSGSKTSCTAKDCGPIGTPLNGTKRGRQTTYPNKVIFTCDDGFHLKGLNVRECQSDGAWSGVETFCEAKDCGFLQVPVNGSLVGLYLTTFPNSLTFACNTGFILRGSRVRHCEATAIWSGNETFCQVKDCGPLDVPSNGSMSGDRTTYPHEVSFSCDEGFILRGSQMRSCTSEGTWSGTPVLCEAVDCGYIPTPQNGSKFGENTTYPHSMKFSCDEGFNILGSTVRKCLSNGTWSGQQTLCKAKDCGLIETPLNGTKSGSQTTYPNKVIFTCDDGFNLKGSNVRECQSDGAWSGVETFCEAKDCGFLQVPVNGSLVGLYLTTFPNSLTFACDIGFILKGSLVRRCEANAVWSGNETLCEAKDCGPLDVPSNGSMSGDRTTYPHELSFLCDEGFILRGSKVRSCTSEGTWSRTSASCEAKDCGSLAAPMNGSAIGRKTTYPNEITFGCDDGFNMAGTRIRKCQSTGIWSGNQTSCTAVDCGYIPTPQNGTKFGQDMTYPHSMEFSCDEGFLILGSTERKCLSNGTWSGQQTLCKAKDCGPIGTPLNGTKRGKQTTYTSKAVFGCDDGFNLRGSNVRECTSDGVWGGVETFCEAKDCGFLNIPVNGSLVGLNVTTFPNSLIFACDKGFILKGSRVRHCQANAIWSGNETFCQAKDCGPLEAPTNGSLFGDRTTYPHDVSFTCDDGFILKGSKRRRCTSDGAWNGTPASCEAKDCGALAVPMNGSAIGRKTTYPNKITFSCDNGFNMAGSKIRKCQSNGIWSGNQTSCAAVDCGYITTPHNGSKLGEQTTYPHSVRFNCDEGFIMLGSTVRYCLANGIWSGQKTLCKAKDCGSLSIPMNGSSSGHDTTFPNIISFSCDVGFIMIGSQARKCQSKGKWSGNETSCRAVECGSLVMPMNGSSYGELTTYPNKVDFQCDEGFVLKGSSVRVCLENGSWSGNDTSCKAVECGRLSAPLNGSVQGSATTFPNMLEFSCEKGFILDGFASRKCQANTTWSGKAAICRARDCGSLPVPMNGTIIGNQTTYPSKLTFFCDEGFDLIGSSVRQCETNGKWNGQQPACIAVDCGPLPLLFNGSYIGSLTTFPNKVLSYCDEGFLLRGSSKRLCQANRTWSGTQTKCEAVDCGRLYAPLNGSVEGSATTFPNVLEFSCDEGFILDGSASRTCQANGTWNGLTAHCRAKDCGHLPTPMNGSVIGIQTTYPNKRSFSCDDGFDLLGSTVRRCKADGIWSGEQPTCNAVDCGPLPFLLNGSHFGNLTTYPNKVLLYCDEGFLMRGSAERFCQANRTWSGNETKCEAVDCGGISAPLNGSLQGSSTTFPNVLTFYCDNGFILGGSASRKCQANGTWSGKTTLCRAKDCGHLPTPTNGSVIGIQTTYPNKLSFSCDDGFDLLGSTVRRCEADGIWSGEQPTCNAVDCGSMPLLLNGSYFGNLTTYPNKVLSYCDEGFLLRGSSERFCQANRTWSGTQTKCRAVDCGPPPVPLNGSSYGTLTVFPNAIRFSCDPGFLLGGSVKRQCLPTGVWSGNNTICEAIDCGIPHVPINGSVHGSKTYFPNVLQFACDEGFILHGSRQRQCRANGSWSGNQTFCKAVDCGALPVPLNGSSTGGLTVFPNIIRFSCDPGFFRIGSSRRVCQANGTWSGYDITCNPVDCGKVQAPINGSLRGNYTTFPNKLHFYCDDGFILRGSSARGCMANRTWSGQETTCEAKDCGPILTPKNGSMVGGQTTFPNKVIFSCDEGFIMNGPEKRKCQADGTWSGNVTSCAAVDCGHLDVPLNGSSYGDLTVFPESVRFSCDTGFIMSGSLIRRCQANGTWSGSETICNAIDCGRLPAPVNGTVYGEETTYPNILQFSCDVGFTQHGSTERRCQPNGSWNGNETACQANDCGPLAVPRNGSSLGNETTYPNKVTFSCDEGFILIGSVVRQCQANKFWNGVDTSCKAIDCGFLGMPLNGSSSGDLTVFPNTKRFTCDAGFILGGSSERTCQATGTWSGINTTCTAIDCGHPPTPRNGSMLGERTNYPNILRFRCDEGFTLLGSTVRKCRTNGTWSGVDPICQANDCGDLLIPQNGSLFGNKTTFPNIVTFSCDEGFILKGSKVRQCQANKTWTGDATFCDAVDCGPLDPPRNGSSSGNMTVYPNSVQFKCDPGFILSGSTIRTCQSNGTWSGFTTMCSAIDCGVLHPPQNGSVFGEQTTYPNMLQFSCDDGFTLHGSSDRKCQTNGMWSGTNAFCKANDCGSLSVPKNGTLSGNLTTFPNEIIFSCDEGFILHGSAIRRCQADKQWSGNDTFCEAVNCGPLDVPMNGSLSGNSRVFPNSVQFQCDIGFILSGSAIRTCQANGSWSGSKTLCSAIDCGQLQSPQNGSVFGENTTYPNKLRFTCDEGFTLVGSSDRKCQANGTWSGTTASCQANDCGPLPTPMNGTLSGNVTTYPNQITFTCDEGFILRGSAMRRCQPDKHWSGNNTFCEAKDCGPLAFPTNGSSVGKQTTFPNKITFSCDEGFILGGSQARMCQSNGRWSGKETFCKAKDCGGLVTPTNGSSFGNLTTYPHQVVFNCDEGFNLRGSRIRQCLSSGNWSGNKTICEAEDCGPLPIPTNGSSSVEKTTFPNKMTFSCDDGFIQSGSVIRKCQANGTWSGDATFCEAKDCGSLRAPINGSSIGNLFTFPNKVYFMCDEGFILEGSEMRQCQASGLWTGNHTFCEAVDCGPLESPLNGSLSGNLTVYPNSVRLWCDPGFVLHGSSFRTCRSNGTWDGFQTICEAIDCGKLRTPQNGTMDGEKTTYPNTLKFSCDEGFILGGSWLRECETNGTWSGNETKCQAQDCGPLAVPINGSSNGDLTVFPNKIVFGCDEGFLLRGSDMRHCLANGTWSGNQTFCEAIDCGPLSVPMNGSSSGDSTVFPNNVLFDCDPGFILNGSTIRTCQPNGTWSGILTLCSAVDCGWPQPLQNGSVIGEKTVYPNFVNHSCDEGFILRGSPKIKCQTNGTWSKTSSFCEAKDCGALAVPLNGSITIRETTFPNEASFSCDEGFLLNGSTVRRCQADGSWSGIATSCEAVDCGPLSVPMNGSSSGDSTVFPNNILFNCDPGFILSGSFKRMCRPNGTWSGFVTKCTAKDCGPLAVPTNGSSTGDLTIFPNKIVFGCDEGFNLRGSYNRHCQANGTWSGNHTLCQAQDCGPLAVPTNGSSIGDLTVFPNNIVFGCDEGFLLRGSDMRHCLANGTWSGNRTFCEAVDCGPLSVPMNGSSSGDSTVFPNSVLFNCDPGFNLNGSTIRTCQPNGTWSGILTVCNAVDCGRPQPLQNGSVIGENTVYPNFVNHSCDDGFILRGSPKINCQTNGTWSKTSSFCEAKDCGTLDVPLNGSINEHETTFPNEATFSCDEGFLLNGSTVRRCQADGSWSGINTSCEAVDCGPLATPMNGSSSGDSTVFPNSVQFNCDPGFVLSGSSKRMCRPNGTWSGFVTICTAKDCGPLAVPTNGSSTGDLTIFPNKIIFGCDEGFNLRGSRTRHCQTNGTWSGNQTLCQAVDCGPLSVPMNGSSSGDSTVFPNSVLFKCDPGFILSGSTIRVCQPNGTWNGSPTVCSAIDCGPLSAIMNGSSSGDTTVFPNSIHFNCDPGFILNGSAIRMCQTNGTWSGFETLCSAVDCGKPQPLQNGSIIGKHTVYPNYVNHICDEGFILRGSPKIKCQTNGTWSKTSSFCEAKDCGTLAVPLNGSIDVRETTFPNEATFSCDEGFILNGSTVRRCQADATWSGTETSCQAVDCGPLSVPMNGSSSGDSTVFPNSVIFKCDPGFILNGSSTRMCQANETWSGLVALCVAKDCGSLAVPTNGSSLGDLTVFPNKIRFGCDEGFLLRGSHIRHCQENGNWSGNQTFCEAVDCGPLSASMNGSSSGDSTVFPNSVQLNCDPGFILSGSYRRTCQANGTWSGLPTLCSAVDCGPLFVPMNGSSSGDSTVFPNSVLFNCDPGFILNGSTTRKCQANGTWSGFQALCSAVDCGRPQPLQNGSVSGVNTVYPNFVNHICDEGFILRGSPKIKCQTNGTWSKTSSFCEAKDCGALSIPLNGSIAVRETTFPNEATFSCDEGFLLNGSTVRRCQSDGLWSGIQPSCEAVDCGPLSAPMNGSSSGDSTVFPNSVLFKCDPGFLLNGSSRRTCQSNGTWNGLTTVCVAKDCGPLAVPTNGSSAGDLTIFPNKIVFGCDEGFNLRGSRNRHCQANGTWSGNETLCQAVNCGPLSAPMNGSSSGDSTVFPNSVQFSCDPGFILNGSTVRTCQANGTWNGLTTICVAVDCGPLSVPLNGSSSGDSTVFPNSVQFNCDPGFILNGSTTRMCQSDGTWSGFQTLCSAVDCGHPEPLQNGSVIGEHTVYPNSVTHICDEGFILRGSPKIKCQTNGTWSETSTFCEAKDCGLLKVPLNGSIAGRETTFPNEAKLSCDEGFILTGSTVRRCQANGSWSGIKTSCNAVDCGPLLVPRNGTLSGDLTVFPNRVQFSCNPGFIPSGSLSRKCQANGTWSGKETVCTPVDCGPLHPLQNGSLSGESTVFPNVVSAACDVGFILRGSSQIECEANGTWSSTDTFCEAKDCGNLSKPLNGSVIGFETTYPNELEFKCDVGFELQGSATRKCEADGQWSGEVVQCQAVDCGPSAVPEYGVAHGNSTTYPNMITFSCKTGFFLQGVSTRTCQANGTWTRGDVMCQGMECSEVRPPANGWLFGRDFTHPHSVMFSCGKGFRLVGTSQLTCLKNGSWSDQQPNCLPHSCIKAPDVPVFAYQTWKASKKRYESGERIYYSCKPGFIMVGVPVRQCLMGQWTALRFSCSAPSCNAPRAVPKFAYVTSARGGQSKYLNGEKVYYSCQAGYELVGIPQIECENGVWTEHSFSCKAVICGTLHSPSNGWIQKETGETFGEMYLFMCNVAEGYLMRGSKERRCLANATWSGVQPVCYLQSCDAPVKPVYGKLRSELSNKYFFGKVVEYQCDYGFSARGHESSRCQIHGNWSNPAPKCISCSLPLGLGNRMIFSSQLSASSERDSRHGAKHGRLHGNSAWCSARSSFAKYFQIDFGRTMEVTAVATQGHPREQKWVLKYILRYSLGKHWLAYQESGREKVFKGNRDGTSVVKHYLKETLVAKKIRILRYQNSQDFMGSTACLRAEVYGCNFETDCLTIGSEVFARWHSVNTRYFHGYVTKVRETSVEVSPSGKHGSKVNDIVEWPRAKEYNVIRDKKSKPAEIRIGSEVIVPSMDNIGFSQGKVTQKFVTWYGVELGNGEKIWSKAHDIRLLKKPIYCDKE